MQPNDLMDLMFFDDVQVVKDTKWKTYKQRADLANALNAFKSTMPSHGSDRALFSQIKNMTQDAFGSLGNSDAPDQVPLHQAMVVLSNGAGRGDPESASPERRRLPPVPRSAGASPPDNTSLPKTPLPVISIWFPNPSSFVENIYRNNEAQFMQSLANPEIGGFFDIVKEGEGAAKGKTIIGLVRARFNAMWLIHWELSLHQPQRRADLQPRLREHEPDDRARRHVQGRPARHRPDAVAARRRREEDDARPRAQNPLYPGGHLQRVRQLLLGRRQVAGRGVLHPRRDEARREREQPRPARRASRRCSSSRPRTCSARRSARGDTYVTFTVPDDDKVLDGHGREHGRARWSSTTTRRTGRRRIDEKTVLYAQGDEEAALVAAHRAASPGSPSSSCCS